MFVCDLLLHLYARENFWPVQMTQNEWQTLHEGMVDLTGNGLPAVLLRVGCKGGYQSHAAYRV